MKVKRLVTALAAVLATAAVGTTVAAAPDTKPPRLVAAHVLDRSGNGRADGIRLTYSERVRHAADRSGKFPFRVSGYGIRAVGKANGKAIVLTLVERTAPDADTRPAVTYRRTARGAVRDQARNQAKGQVFRATRAHGYRPATPLPEPQPQPEPKPTSAPDSDGDGWPDDQDCAPSDRQVHPGAPDAPDLAFADSNCDGIDGDERKAVFVSPLGKDSNPGTKAQPKFELQAGVTAAGLAGRDVYVAGGDYRRVETIGGVNIYGGYLGTTWQRVLAARTRIVGSPEAVLAVGHKVVLQLLTVVSLNASAAGASTYAIRAVAGSALTLERVTVIAGRGANGAFGTDGTNGSHGGNGGRGEAGGCDSEVGGLGGAGGASPAGRKGGWGGRGGLERLERNGLTGQSGATGTPGGAGGDNGNPGKTGRRGADGYPGESGTHGDGGVFSVTFAAQRTWTWSGSDGSDGASGKPGMGGGGGGGGGGQKGRFVIDGIGNGGGGGGGAGGGGTGGTGGHAGGGSFGLYLHDSRATISAGSSIQAGDGGTGGNGGRGGLPGPGGTGGSGGTYCTGEIGTGGNGGNGGGGGIGGGGGGGAGGPSIGLLKAGTSAATVTDTQIAVGTPGNAGAPGPGGSGGGPSYPGIATPVYPQPQ